MHPRRLGWAALVAISILLAAVSAGASSHWSISAASNSTAQGRATSPAAPTDVTSSCTSSSTTEATVRWSTATHATKYTVYDSKTSGSYASLGTTTTATYTSSALTSGKYTFEVTTSIGTKWTSAKSSATSPALKMTTRRGTCVTT